MITFFTALSVSFVSVFLKGFQHKNVNGNHYRLVALFSYIMATMDVIMIGLISKNGFEVAIPCGTGATLGIVISMYLHNRFVKPKSKVD